MKNFARKFIALAVASAALAVAGAAIVIGGYYYVEPSLPDVEELHDVRLQTPLRIYSRDGRLMAEVGQQRRRPVPYEAFPPRLVEAVLAAEDDTFFEHSGLDVTGTAVAAVRFLLAGGTRVPGGSTITQQVAKTYFLSSEFSLDRKFKEWILAFRIEREFSKREILELYLNTNFFGQSSYGVVAAARTYFDKRLDELSLSEMAIIVGIQPAPSRMNPYTSPESAAVRRAYVLRRMAELGMIDEAERQEALAEPILSRRYGSQTQLDAPYVAEMIRVELLRRFGEAAYTAGLKVTTTIDSRLQRAANAAVRQTLLNYDERHGYRGPIRSLDWAEEGLEPADDEKGWREILADYENPVGFQTALVLEADDASATIYLSEYGRQTIGLDAVEWAAPYVNENVVGARPKTVAEVLTPGDIVRFRTLDDGSLRLAQLPDVQGAFVALDPQDGAIASLVGGFDFFLSNYNRATQPKRQPGSSFKPFVYSAALENGFTTASIVYDSPFTEYSADLESVWKPENYEGRWHGPTRLREALVRSLNSVAVRVILEAGVLNTISHLRKFGFDQTALPHNATLALGAGGVSPHDLVSGYAVFANGGFKVSPYFIQRIEDASGNVLYEAMPEVVCAGCDDEDAPALASTAARVAQDSVDVLVEDASELFPDIRRAKRILPAENAYLVTDMMRDVVRRGSGNRAQRELGRRDLSGKTGTTNGPSDAWFAGFNADIVATAWVGFDDPERLLGRSEQGGVTAIPMWISFMAEALDGMPERTMASPPGIVEVRINPETGLAASGSNRNAIFEKFRIGHVPPRESDPVSSRSPTGPVPDEQVRPGEKIF